MSFSDLILVESLHLEIKKTGTKKIIEYGVSKLLPDSIPQINDCLEKIKRPIHLCFFQLKDSCIVIMDVFEMKTIRHIIDYLSSILGKKITHLKFSAIEMWRIYQKQDCILELRLKSIGSHIDELTISGADLNEDFLLSSLLVDESKNEIHHIQAMDKARGIAFKVAMDGRLSIVPELSSDNTIELISSLIGRAYGFNKN